MNHSSHIEDDRLICQFTDIAICLAAALNYAFDFVAGLHREKELLKITAK